MYILMGSMFIVNSLIVGVLGVLSYFYEFSYFYEWEFMSLNSLEFIYVMLFDWISLSFVSLVMMISGAVLVYSHTYMYEDGSKMRFLWLVFLFVVSMLLMIISPNLFSIILGWDGLGLVSFCLIIYFQNIKAYNAGMLTILSNRMGDGFLLVLMGYLFSLSSWNFWFFYLSVPVQFLITASFLLVMVSITKSAQIPFSSWLPAAMAAPTPVSALVHSSTLVTAGVYLVIRFFFLLKLGNVLKYLLLLGLLTMFMSGLSAMFEVDFKKIIALSTLSQLGLMMSTLGLEFKDLCFFHLMTHAFFKACLFLCAGILIHSFWNFQDIRYFGGLSKYFPMIFSCFMVSNLSLMGMFFMAGFYSKDMILEAMSMKNVNFLVYLFFYLSILLTLLYSLRLLLFMFMNMNNFFVMNIFHEEDKFMLMGVSVLMFLSIIMGSVYKWFFKFTMKFIYLYDSLKKLILVIMAFSLIFIFIFWYNFMFMKKIYFLFVMNSFMWFLSLITVFFFNKQILVFGKKLIKIFDMGWIENMFKHNMINYIIYVMNYFMSVQYNFIKVFIMMFFIIIFMMIFYLI